MWLGCTPFGCRAGRWALDEDAASELAQADGDYLGEAVCRPVATAFMSVYIILKEKNIDINIFKLYLYKM